MKNENTNQILFYYCQICGNLVQMIHASGQPMLCCNQTMKEVKAGIMDASVEHHVPTWKRKDDRIIVTIGEKDHPMTEEHYIQWIEIVTNEGYQWKHLEPGCKPKSCFYLHSDENVLAIYAYCNKHGLWMADVT